MNSMVALFCMHRLVTVLHFFHTFVHTKLTDSATIITVAMFLNLLHVHYKNKNAYVFFRITPVFSVVFKYYNIYKSYLNTSVSN